MDHHNDNTFQVSVKGLFFNVDNPSEFWGPQNGSQVPF